MPKFIPKLIRAADDTLQPIKPKNGKRFTMDEIRSLIGCRYLQRVVPPGVTGAVMYCNEHAKIQDNPPPINRPATVLWQEGCEPGSPRSTDDVLGDVLLCHTTQEPK